MQASVLCVSTQAFIYNHLDYRVVISVQTAAITIVQMRVSAFLELYLQVAGRDLTLR